MTRNTCQTCSGTVFVSNINLKYVCLIYSYSWTVNITSIRHRNFVVCYLFERYYFHPPLKIKVEIASSAIHGFHRKKDCTVYIFTHASLPTDMMWFMKGMSSGIVLDNWMHNPPSDKNYMTIQVNWSYNMHLWGIIQLYTGLSKDFLLMLKDCLSREVFVLYNTTVYIHSFLSLCQILYLRAARSTTNTASLRRNSISCIFDIILKLIV